MAKKVARSGALNGTRRHTPIPSPENANDVPSIYCNSFEMLSMNYVDVRIGFNEIIVESGNNVSSKRKANIVMSVDAFLAFVKVTGANAQKLSAERQQQIATADAAMTSHIAASLKN